VYVVHAWDGPFSVLAETLLLRFNTAESRAETVLWVGAPPGPPVLLAPGCYALLSRGPVLPVLTAPSPNRRVQLAAE